MPRPAKDTMQITIRVPTSWLERIDAVVAHLGPQQTSLGATFGRPDAFRAAMARGLEILSREAAAKMEKTDE